MFFVGIFPPVVGRPGGAHTPKAELSGGERGLCRGHGIEND